MSADTAPAAMPGEEDVARAAYEAICGCYGTRPNWDDEPAEVKAVHRAQARAILDLFAPILAEKEREIERACSDHANATIGWERERGRAETLETRALAAEAAVLAVAPYVDSIVCYASTVDEHDGNRVAKLVNEAAAAIRAQGE